MVKRPNAPADAAHIIADVDKRLSNLDLSGWLQELAQLHKASVEHGLGLHCDDKNIFAMSDALVGQIGGPFVSFMVDARLPDDCIRAEFERWLAELRKQVPPAVVKTGPAAANGRFDRRKLDTWKSLKIIQFGLLLVWRAALPLNERQNFSEATLGAWLGRMTPKDVNTTKRSLKAALQCLPAMFAQVGHEMAQNPAAQNAMAARIARDLAR